MTLNARSASSVVLAGAFVGYFWNGPGALGRFILSAVVLLVVAGVIDVRTWWKATR